MEKNESVGGIPEVLSSALTLSTPLASMSKMTLICGTPRGAGGMPVSSNLPSKLLSRVRDRSPSYTCAAGIAQSGSASGRRQLHSGQRWQAQMARVPGTVLLRHSSPGRGRKNGTGKQCLGGGFPHPRSTTARPDSNAHPANFNMLLSSKLIQ